jgi:hypothetical protein
MGCNRAVVRSISVRLLFASHLIAASGCTAAQLQRHTISQAATVHDIYQQQILDNVAMFVHNRGSCPFFVLINQGTSTLTDTGTLANTNGWSRIAATAIAPATFAYASTGLNPSAMRAQQGSWQTYPISDSVKLNVMQCIYRQAVGHNFNDGCPDCANLFYAYYNIEPPMTTNSIPYNGGPNNDPNNPANRTYVRGSVVKNSDPTGYDIYTDLPFTATDAFKGYTIQIETPNGPEATFVASSRESDKKTILTLTSQFQTPPVEKTPFLLSISSRLPIRGIVTPECLSFPQGWFCCGKKLPKCCNDCTPHGSYCGTHIWVPPEGVETLTKLTLLIQDVAYYEPPRAEQKSVTTQKPKDAAGPKATAAALLMLESKMKSLQDSDLESEESKESLNMLRLELLMEAVKVQQESTETTTTIITTQPNRQPTQFQPGVLGIQQQLNMLPQPQPQP